MFRFLITALGILLVIARPAFASPPGERLRDRLAPTPTETIDAANTILAELTKIPDKSIPPAVLADAQGVAIIPRVVKAGFVVAGQGGHGVLFARDKAGAWGEPVFLNLGGASVGFQVGVESTDVVLVFRERTSLDRLLEGKGKVTLGADAAIAAGPVGRQLAAGTDGQIKAEIVSYSRSRGLFAGVALDGAIIRPDANSNATYKADIRPELSTQVAKLKAQIGEMSTKPAPPFLAAPPAPAKRP